MYISQKLLRFILKIIALLKKNKKYIMKIYIILIKLGLE